MVTGEFAISMDEKGRISIPGKLRARLTGDALYITRGLESTIWLMLPDEFEAFAKRVIGGPGDAFNPGRRTIQRAMIAPAQYCTIDKNNRVGIPQPLRISLGMDTRCEVTLLGAGSYLELWRSDVWRAYRVQQSEKVEEAARELACLSEEI